DAPDIPAARTRGLREAVARQRRRDHMEGVGGLAAMSFGVGQPRDDVEKLHDRAGPAVHEKQRKGVGTSGASVDEMDRLAIDPGAEVREMIEPRLLGSPVVLVAP